MTDTVEYRDIPGFPGYRAGSDGSIWSCLDRIKRMTGQWHQLKAQPQQGPRPPMRGRYLSVHLGHRRTFRVHRLVLLAFVGPCPSGMEGCHKDNDPANNAVSNLCWDTRGANRRNSMSDPAWPRGERKTKSKLTEEQVVSIHLLHREGWKKTAIAGRFGVGRTTVRYILDGRKWGHVRRALIADGRLPLPPGEECPICHGAGGPAHGDRDSDGTACRGCGE